MSLNEALNAAVRARRRDQAEQLLAAGAELNASDRVGSAPLHVAAWSGNVRVASLLISHGADVNAMETETGSTPLDYAVLSGTYAMLKLLLGAGAHRYSESLSRGAASRCRRA